MTDVLQIFDLASCVFEQYLWMHFNKLELYVLSLPSSLWDDIDELFYKVLPRLSVSQTLHNKDSKMYHHQHQIIVAL